MFHFEMFISLRRNEGDITYVGDGFMQHLFLKWIDLLHIVKIKRNIILLISYLSLVLHVGFAHINWLDGHSSHFVVSSWSKILKIIFYISRGIKALIEGGSFDTFNAFVVQVLQGYF